MDILDDLCVSRETTALLAQFADLTCKWTPKINLIAASTVAGVWERHILDSAQLYQFVPPVFATWIDIGSGGGFPGIVAAVIAKEKNPGAQFCLIESDQRKSTFLRTAIRELDLNAKVIADRIENASCDKADIVSARALASLDKLLPLITKLKKPDGIGLLHKGKQWDSEIFAAKKNWDFEVLDLASKTDPNARILKIGRIARV